MDTINIKQQIIKIERRLVELSEDAECKELSGKLEALMRELKIKYPSSTFCDDCCIGQKLSMGCEDNINFSRSNFACDIFILAENQVGI